VTERDNVRTAMARLVRQSLEMGDAEWFLDRMDRRTALELLGSGASGGTPPPEGEQTIDVVGERLVGAVESGATDGAPAGGEEGAGTPDWKARPDAASPADLPVLPDDYDALRELALGCTRCGLSGTRTQVVFSDGASDARLMVVGEAPGANEDKTGVPFVGAAGRFLDLLLATVDLSREESVYICNVLKCRPPGNRNPKPDEIRTCSPYLLKQIQLVRPEVILAVGSFSAQLLTGREKTALGRLRGEVHSYAGVPLVVTYHPAALLRNANWTRAFWDDLQLLRDVMDQPG
jgi:DNA polymerase